MRLVSQHIAALAVAASILALVSTALADDVETSPSGAPILRHQDHDEGLVPPEQHARNLEDIEAHVEKYIGPIDSIFHEHVSDRVHIDIIVVSPTEERPYTVLVTSGVGDLPMSVPEGYEYLERAELVIALPASWPVNDEAFKDDANYWPVRCLKIVGLLPHTYDTWIGWGHTIPNGDPWESIAGTRFIGVMLSMPYWLDENFWLLQASSGDEINFYDMVPLYSEEMKLKLNQGAEELEARFDNLRLGYILDVERPNAGLPGGRRQR